mmetsp:Transcript_4021/g.15134  ORF Transcript_4021/g.15134 Transcript_4021/m.15134 type:complete len:523 (+) Transcript_4021:2776-4344(+)
MLFAVFKFLFKYTLVSLISIIILISCYTLPHQHYSVHNRHYLRHHHDGHFIWHLYQRDVKLHLWRVHALVSSSSSNNNNNNHNLTNGATLTSMQGDSSRWWKRPPFPPSENAYFAADDNPLQYNSTSLLPPVTKRFTVLMVTHNRMDYLQTILYYLRPYNQFLCDRDEFLLIDYLSNEEDVRLPAQLKDPEFQVDGGAAMRDMPHHFKSDLAIMQNSCVKLLRKHHNWTHADEIYKHYDSVNSLPPVSYFEKYPNEPQGDSTFHRDALFTEKPKYFVFTERNHDDLFSMWKAWLFALRHVQSERIFYFDNCNRPTKYFHYTIFMNPDRAFYFPNVHRFYNQNFSLERRSFLKFLLELPGHFLLDKRSFFGVDQLFPWYFQSTRAMPKFHHIPHTTMSNYERYYPHVAVQWRIFLWLNYYGTPKRYYSRDFCIGPKRVLCFGDGLILKVLKVPVLFHIADSLLFFEWFVAPFVMIFNWTQNTVASILLSVVINVMALSIVGWIIGAVLFSKIEWTKLGKGKKE